MRVPVLDLATHVALHAAVDPFRDELDDSLLPGVFGYRRGADRTSRYAAEWQRLVNRASELCDEAAHVVVADVERFFTAASWQRVLDALAEVSDRADLLNSVADSLEDSGLPHLPAGYADARMLANGLLHSVDCQLQVPFVRWVDDYTLFVPRSLSPETVIQELDGLLVRCGLRLNLTKTLVLSREQAARRFTNRLGDVYRPDRDSPEVVRAVLRDLFSVAATDPSRRRRELRFSLARLEREQDDSAVESAVRLLSTAPWEAPRLISYLSVFAEDERVRTAVNSLLPTAARAGEVWRVARLCPLAYQTGLSRDAMVRLVGSLPAIRATPAWGLALRVAALAGLERAVRVELRDAGAVGDRRSALVALRDLEASIDPVLWEGEPELALALESVAAPFPTTKSLL